jgi:thioredoxin 1
MASKNLKSLNELDFDSAIANSTVPVLVDFGAEWCAPCKAQAKVLERMADESRFAIVTVDIDECPGLAARYGVRGVPTLLAFSGGKETARRLGLANEASIRALLNVRTSGAAGAVARAE